MAACAKLHEMQFLCIAKRVTVNDVNSNTVHIPLFFKIFSFRSSSGVYTDFFPFLCIAKRVTVNSNDKAADQVVHHEKSKQKLFS